MKTSTSTPMWMGSNFSHKAWISIIILLGATGSVFAQTLQLTSSMPVNLETNVPLNTTVSITFSEKVDYSAADMFVSFTVIPLEAIEILGSSFSPDSTTITFDVIHQPNTDYSWFFINTSTPDSRFLGNFGLVRYTTAPAFGDRSISGNIQFVNNPFYHDFDDVTENSEMAKNVQSTEMNQQPNANLGIFDPKNITFSTKNSNSQLQRYAEKMVAEAVESDIVSGNGVSYLYNVVILLDNSDYFTGDGENNEDEVPSGVRYAAIGEAETGNFIFDNVQPGLYYALAFLFEPYFDYMDRYDYMEMYAYGYYNDDTRAPIPVDISTENASDIIIGVYGFRPDLLTPTDALDIMPIVLAYKNDEAPNSKILGMFGEFTNLSDGLFKSVASLSQTSIAKRISSSQNVNKVATDETLANIAPDGTSYLWDIVLFDTETQRVDMLFFLGGILVETHVLNYIDIPDHDKPLLQELLDASPLPAAFSGSVAAVTIALQNGLQADILEITEYAWYHIDYSLSGFWFEYNEFFTGPVDPFWAITFYMGDYDFETNTFFEMENTYLIDAISGDFIDVITRLFVEEKEPFYLISSDPMGGSTNVPTNASIRFTFNNPVEYDLFEQFNYGTQFQIYPAGLMNIHNVSYHDSSVTLQVEHLADTVYTWVLVSPRSLSNVPSDQSYTLTYTTKSELSTQSVSGRVTFTNTYGSHGKSILAGKNGGFDKMFIFGADGNRAAKVEESKFHALQRAHDTSTSFESAFKTPTDGQVEVNARFTPEQVFTHGVVVLHTQYSDQINWKSGIDFEHGVFATITDPLTGAFTFDFVPDGEYFVSVHLHDVRHYYPWQFGKGILRDENNNPIAIKVEGGSVEGLEFMAFGFHEDLAERVSAKGAVSKAQVYVAPNQANPMLVFLEGFESNSTFRKTPMFSADNSGGEITEEPYTFPSGRLVTWNMAFMDTANRRTDFIEMADVIVLHHESMSFDEIPPERMPPISMDSLKMVPNQYLDSFEALQIALQNGMQQILDTQHRDAWIEVVYTLSNYDFMYPEVLSYDDGAFWAINFLSHYWPPLSDDMEYAEGTWIIDAETGTLIEKFIEVSVDEALALPREVMLNQNYPNPFNPSTFIRFELPDATPVTITVFDLTGRKVAVISDGFYAAGEHTLRFDAKNLSSGVYVYQLRTPGAVLTKKFTLLK